MKIHLLSKLALALLVFCMIAGDAMARSGRGGGGGGSRGGGGFKGGGGSVRYSGGNRPSTSKPSSVNRPKPSSASRPKASVADRPKVQNKGVSKTDVPRQAGPAAPARQLPKKSGYAGNSYRPANMGSITKAKSSFVNGSIGTGHPSQLPSGAAGGTWTGPRGGTIGGIKGPAGGGVVAGKGPGGGAFVKAGGPRGGSAGGVRGPGGNTAWARTLPDGSRQVNFNGTNYWNNGYNYYRPYWYNDEWWYARVYPPVGVCWDSVPEDYDEVVINNNTYYTDDEGTYVQEENGKYKVVEDPTGGEKTPDPMEVLRKMADYIAQQKDFSVLVKETAEEVLDNGSKAQTEDERTLNVRRPDMLFSKIRSAENNRNFFFNKGAATAVDYGTQSYSELKMPSTIDGMLDELSKKYGFSMLLGDLLYTDAYPRLSSSIESAEYVGMSEEPANCHHLAFSQEAVDWEIWIDAGEKPLPRKLLVTYKALEGSPRYEADIRKWDSAANPDGVFTPKIPESMKKIDVAPAD